MRFLLRAIPAGGLGFAVALLIAACGGGSRLLSSDQSSTLSNQLTQISSALAAGNCDRVTTGATGLTDAVAGLPPSVSATLRNNLIQGASTVAELAQKDCHQATVTPQPTAPQQTPPPAATPTTTPQQPTTPTTAPTTPTTPTAPTTSTTPATTPTTSGTTPTGGTGGAGLGSGGGTGGAGISTPAAGNNG